MRYLYFLIVCFLICSCNAKQKVLVENENDKITKFCPEDGVCTFEVLENKSIELLKDGIGKLYTNIIDDNNIVLKFEYIRNEIPNTVDGSYRELVYAELDPNNLTVEIENSQLKEVKLLFARFCFCRGQTGYYNVNKGNLSITRSGNNYQFNLEFIIDEVPQVITVVNQTFTLE